MATVGAMSVDMFMNNKHYLAGVSAATSATKRMESEISSSIAKINAKQMKSVTNNLLGNFGVVGMFQAGANMATELVKGFNSEAIKGFGDAMGVLGNTLVSAIRALPIAGAFLQLGEEIGKSIFGDAQKEIDETILKMQKLDVTLKNIQAPNIIIESMLAEKQSEVTNFGESEQAKKRRLYVDQITNANKQSFIDQYNERLKNSPKEFTTEKVKVAGDQGGTREIEVQKKNLNYEKDMEAFVTRTNDAMLDVKHTQIENLNTAMKRYDVLEAEHEVLLRNKKIDEELAQQLKDIAEEKKQYYEDQAKAIAKQIKLTKDLAREQLDKDKAFAFQNAQEAYDKYLDALVAYDENVARIKKESGNASGAIGLNTAIGTVKVAAVVDYGVQKQIDLAAQILKEAKENNMNMQEINVAIRAIASIP